MKSLRAVAFVACCSWSIASAAAAPARTPASGTMTMAEVVVGEGKASKGAFVVSVGECARAKGAPKDALAECVVTVAAARGGSGRQRLEWRVPAGAIAHPNEFTAVVGDDPDHRVTLRWRPIVLGDPKQRGGGLAALIVTEETHGDRSKRRHDVLALRGGHLERVLGADEGRGRTWSSLTAADIDGDGGDELVLQRSSTPDEEQPDQWSFEVRGWRADVAKLVARNDVRPQVKGAVIGMFKTVADARQFAGHGCAAGYLVLDGTSLDLLAPGQIVVAQPTLTKDDAELALEALRACNAGLSGGVKPLTAGVDVDSR